jgi:D-amino-acid dehydrogenase
MSMETIRVAVVGAGIVGVATAVWLQRAGCSVVLIDRDAPGAGASFGNGGVLAACASVPVTVPGLIGRAPRMALDPGAPLFVRWSHLPRIAPWLVRYLGHATAADARRTAQALHPLLVDTLADHRALASGTPAERYIAACDYLYLYRNRAGFTADRFGWELRRDLGWHWDEIEGPALAEAAAGYTPDLAFGVRLGGHGRITDPGAYVRALADHVAARGGRFVRASVTDVVRDGGRLCGLRADARTIPCDAAVVAAGAWSGPLAKRLGLRLPLESERGYHVELWEPSAMPPLPVMLADAKFVITPMEGRLRLAGLLEFGGLNAPATRAPRAFLLRRARAALPGLTWRRETAWLGHRPALTDSLPAIGPVPGHEGVYIGVGHHHVGLTAGAATGRLLAHLVTGRRPNIDLAPYAPARFQ